MTKGLLGWNPLPKEPIFSHPQQIRSEIAVALDRTDKTFQEDSEIAASTYNTQIFVPA